MTVTDPAPETRRKAPRWMTVLLVASLAMNLLIAGVIASAAWRFHHGPPGPPINANLLGYTSTLPEDRREAIWNSTADVRRSLRPLRAEVRNARAEAHAALVAEPFDRNRYAAAQTRVLEAEVKARTEAQRLFLGIAESLSPDERRAFASWQPPRKGSHRRGGWWQRRGFPPDDEHGPPAAPSGSQEPAGAPQQK